MSSDSFTSCISCTRSSFMVFLPPQMVTEWLTGGKLRGGVFSRVWIRAAHLQTPKPSMSSQSALLKSLPRDGSADHRGAHTRGPCASATTTSRLQHGLASAPSVVVPPPPQHRPQAWGPEEDQPLTA